MTTVCLAPPVVDRTFRALGTDVRLIAEGFGAQDAVRRAHADVLAYHARLSRFEPDSELSRLNDDPRGVVPASALLRDAVRAGRDAAAMSDGLVDPCLLDALHAAGYRGSYVAPRRPVGLPVADAPRPARAHPDERWRALAVDDERETVARPPGLRLDLGGTGKGHAADLVAARLAHLPRWVVSCGGDLRLAGERAVEVAHPLRPRPAATLRLAAGAAATSSITGRAWLDDGGRPAH
ncbi:MAG TPA: FAD:protein FMN transferase, partial [Capillimicrobium sp.]